ncbi:MAG: hypothetical protein WGN25_03095 [Candidatus Electrothrix sp. GW3-4]|uniref:hypothetical protein n=1 Tax=Candidatus Electrothrix sp. GW3-4 TaxID=3126740 RepID=UPI0030D3CF83
MRSSILLFGDYCLDNGVHFSWLECTLEDKIPEYKEWITARRLEDAEGLEQERKIA